MRRGGGGGGSLEGSLSHPRRSRARWSVSLDLFLAFEPIQWWAMLYGDSSHLNMGEIDALYRFERVKDQHARGARGGGSTLLERTTCVRSEVTALHVYQAISSSASTLPSAVLTTLRIAEGRYGTREANEQLDLASNALKGNVLS